MASTVARKDMSVLLCAAERDVADGRSIGRDDRHQFRFIVSAERSGRAYPHRSQSFVGMHIRGRASTPGRDCGTDRRDLGLEWQVNYKGATGWDRTTIVPVSLVCLQAGGRPGVG
jgi:hypothetical protein